MDLKKLSLEELRELLKNVKTELAEREVVKNVIYLTDFNYGNSGYKRWAKTITSIDTTKNGLSVVDGEWLKKENDVEQELPVGTLVLEYMETKYDQIKVYKVIADKEKELVLEADKTGLVSFIRNLKKILDV